MIVARLRMHRQRLFAACSLLGNGFKVRVFPTVLCCENFRIVREDPLCGAGYRIEQVTVRFIMGRQSAAVVRNIQITTADGRWHVAKHAYLDVTISNGIQFLYPDFL